jgi:hypothetical protein
LFLLQEITSLLFVGVFSAHILLRCVGIYIFLFTILNCLILDYLITPNTITPYRALTELTLVCPIVLLDHDCL